MQTLRELYLKSGNQCAFPGCKRIMIDDKGVFIGQVCHIEAAEPGGERFNDTQSNEDRRKFDNLMLMCYEHHVTTNAVETYSVEKLKAFKGEHEAKFSDIASKLRDSISDYTEASEVIPPENLRGLYAPGECVLTPEQLEGSIQDVMAFANKVRALPVPTRELLAVIVRRAEMSNGFHHSSLAISIPEIKHCCDLSGEVLSEHLYILERYNLICEEDPDNFNGLRAIRLQKNESGWDIFEDIRELSSDRKNLIDQILVGLDFSLFDSE